MSTIENFFSSFEEMVESALKISEGRHAITFQKLVFSSILDGLSKTVASDKFNNFGRFSRFIVQFCEWPYHSKVSIPHLVRFSKLVPCREFESLRRAAMEELDKWEDGTTITLERDFDKAYVQSLWPNENQLKEAIRGISLENLTHIALLWKYRNALVHEIRRLGFGMDTLDFKEPSYHSMSHDDREEYFEVWELMYPIKF